jgi:hypothetical protein
MRAEVVYHEKWMNDDNIVEIKVWSVPVTKDKPHGYKYSLVYIKSGERIVGYDNAEGRGDHRHYRGKEEPYEFADLDKLLQDFYADVGRWWK